VRFNSAAVRAPVTSRLEEIATVVALAAGAAAAATIALSLLEDVHRQVDNETAVKALTILDVIESSSLQVGLLIGGFLVSASAGRADWFLDPYRLYLLTATILMFLALALRSLRAQPGEAQPPPGERAQGDATVRTAT
jgi:branched-subunit amino acid ABC-type transport system permease component